MAEPSRRGLAAKLRITAALLGCPTRKDLCARFRSVNPATEFDLERSHKWLQGRALPRSARIYDDWAKLIGIGRPPAWLAGCSVQAFLDEVCALHEAEPETLLRHAGLPGAAAGDGPAERSFGGIDYLRGAYACYSHAWSPYFRGQLIRGALVIEAGRGASLQATYSEALPVGRVEVRGAVVLAGRSLFMHLIEPGGGLPIFFCLSMPGPPASVLPGVMAGATAVDPDPQPSATRVVMIRAAAAATSLEASNRYLDRSAAALASDLDVLGLAAPGDLALALDAFLGAGPCGGFDQVSREEATRLIAAFDRLLLDGMTLRQPPVRAASH